MSSANFTSVLRRVERGRDRREPVVNEQGKITISKLPGKPKPPTITLKRGKNGARSSGTGTTLMQGTPDRRNGSVVLMNTIGEEVARYNFTNAWVSKLSLSEGGATASGVQIEEVTLSCETLIKG